MYGSWSSPCSSWMPNHPKISLKRKTTPALDFLSIVPDYQRHLAAAKVTTKVNKRQKCSFWTYLTISEGSPVLTKKLWRAESLFTQIANQCFRIFCFIWLESASSVGKGTDGQHTRSELSERVLSQKRRGKTLTRVSDRENARANAEFLMERERKMLKLTDW